VRAGSRAGALAGAALALLVCACALLPGGLPRPPADAFAPVAGGTKLTPPDPAFDPAPVIRRLRGLRPKLADAETRALARVLVDAARRHDLEPRLVLAVIQVESGFRTRAVSPVGALGLMQIMPATGEELAARLGIEWRGPDTLFDPVANVRIGAAYLRELDDRYGSLSTALAAYNWGPGRIDRRLAGGEPVPVIYPRLVRSAYGRLSRDVRS